MASTTESEAARLRGSNDLLAGRERSLCDKIGSLEGRVEGLLAERARLTDSEAELRRTLQVRACASLSCAPAGGCASLPACSLLVNFMRSSPSLHGAAGHDRARGQAAGGQHGVQRTAAGA
jgi:hypothetical protein